MAESTLLWHDYETFGSLLRPWDRPGTVAPKRARPSQFAAIRTDENLNEIGEPIEFHCRPSRRRAAINRCVPHDRHCSAGHTGLGAYLKSEFFYRTGT